MTSELAIILLFKKRWRLFLLSLCVCLILGTLMVSQQVKSINESKNSFVEQKTNGHSESDQDAIALLKVQKYKQIAIPNKPIEDILKHFVNEDFILDFRPYVQTAYFDYYIIFYETTDFDPLPSLIQALNSHPIIIETRKNIFALIPTLNEEQNDVKAYAKKVEQEGFFAFSDIALPDLNFSNNRPINKHYIYLDKNRISQKGYHIHSTEIIKGHTSLNSNKIWVFMIICSILISIFVVFSIENISTLLKRMKTIK
nr:hypothetical protein [uncultured Helicobacter sp.]